MLPAPLCIHVCLRRAGRGCEFLTRDSFPTTVAMEEISIAHDLEMIAYSRVVKLESLSIPSRCQMLEKASNETGDVAEQTDESKSASLDKSVPLRRCHSNGQ